MATFIVKTEDLPKQIRLTVPRKLAENAGLCPDQYITMKINNDKTIKLEVFRIDGKED